ncbi:MAG TPA: alpha/beta fold hydrolase [Alphaproteobacteria bacterium]
MSSEHTESVILLHGMMRTYRCMRRLEKHLVKHGYRVLNLDYPSSRKSLEDLIDHMHPAIDDFNKDTTGPVHFAGYSMGGLLIRAYLHKYRPLNLGRVVMIGTPNKGSEVADFLQNFWPYKKFYGPAGQQLITNQTGFNHIFGPIDFPLGVIAGNRPLDFISSYIIGQPNDDKVSIESTKIDGMTDHIIIPASHTFIARHNETLSNTLKFFQDGSFSSIS